MIFNYDGQACLLAICTTRQGAGFLALMNGIDVMSMIMICLYMLLAGLQVNHEDFNEGIIQVQSKKKANLNYYA